jgi:hypothetical protein
MKSFLQGKKTLETESLRPPVQFASPHAPRCDALRSSLTAATPGASSAQVEVVKEGDKIVRLIVHCVCGERVEVECLYSAGT